MDSLKTHVVRAIGDQAFLQGFCLNCDQNDYEAAGMEALNFLEAHAKDGISIQDFWEHFLEQLSPEFDWRNKEGPQAVYNALAFTVQDKINDEIKAATGIEQTVAGAKCEVNKKGVTKVVFEEGLQCEPEQLRAQLLKSASSLKLLSPCTVDALKDCADIDVPKLQEEAAEVRKAQGYAALFDDDSMREILGVCKDFHVRFEKVCDWSLEDVHQDLLDGLETQVCNQLDSELGEVCGLQDTAEPIIRLRDNDNDEEECGRNLDESFRMNFADRFEINPHEIDRVQAHFQRHPADLSKLSVGCRNAVFASAHLDISVAREQSEEKQQSKGRGR